MPERVEIREEIQRLEKKLEAVSVGGQPLEGFEADYERISQQLARLKEQLLTIEAPHFSRLIEEARTRAGEERFTEALRALEDAEGYVGEFEERRAVLARTRDEITRAWETWKKARAERIQQALEDTTRPLPSEIDTWIEDFRVQAPDQESRVTEWLKQLESRRYQERATQAAEALRQELQPLWEECDRATVAGEIVAATEAAQEALRRARELERLYPDVASVQELVKKAEEWEKTARGAATTAALTANFKRMLEEYEELRKRGYRELPSPRVVREADRLKFVTEETGKEILLVEPDWELVPAEQAIHELEVLATDYAVQKAEEKLEQARQSVNHDPHRASTLLREIGALFVPPSRRGERRWQEIQERLAEFEQITLQPALRRREEAERRRQAALTLPDVLKAWDELGEVERLDPNVPGIDEARASLHGRLIFQAERALEEARSLRQRGQWEKAIETVEPFLRCIRQDERLAEQAQKLEEFVQTCEQGRREDASVREELRAIQELVSQNQLQEAHERLDALEKRLGENRAVYPEVGQLRDRIDARLRLDELLHRADLLHDTARSDTEIEQMIQALEKAAEEHRARVGEILSRQKRLQARLQFRQAERDYLQGTADFHQVRRRFQAVVDLGGADAERAKQYLEEMDKEEQEAEEIQRTIRAAEEHIRANRHRQAYELLHPLATRQPPVRQHAVVWNLYEKARGSLIGEIERELSRLQKRRRLDVPSILRIKEELEELDPVRAKEWNELVARCYIQQAREAATPGEALKYWTEARNLVSPDSPLFPDVARGLREAEKAAEFQKVDILVGAWEKAVDILERLRARYPDDPEIRLRLGEVYLESNNLSAARMHLESASRLLGQMEEAFSPGLELRLGEVQRQLEAAERVQQEQRQIERMLKPENPLDDFVAARRRVNRLFRQRGVDRRVLEEWWESLVDRVVQELEDEYREQQERGEALWMAGRTMLKILELRPESGKARDVLTAIARRSLDVLTRVEQEVHRTTGPVSAVPAERALEVQIQEASRLLEEAEVYQSIFQRRGGELASLRPDGLDEAVRRLRSWRDRLLVLKTRIEEARGFLSTAMRTGEQRMWEHCEELIGQIGRTFDRSEPDAAPSPHVFPADAASFASHPTVRLLVEEYQHARKTRQRLEEYVEEIPKAWRREDFDRVRWLIRELWREDPDGQKYGLSNRRIRLRVMEDVDLDLGQLEQLLTGREKQLKKVADWAEAAWRVVPWRPLPPRRLEILPEGAEGLEPQVVSTLDAIHRAIQGGDFRGAGMAYTSLPIAEPEGTEVLLEPIRERVEQAVRRADFRGAMEWCLKALCGEVPGDVAESLKEESPNVAQALEKWRNAREKQEGGFLWVPGSGEYWSLWKAREWLAEPPLEEGHPLSRRAGLVLARAMALAIEVDAWAEEAESELETIAETQQRFKSLLEDANELLAQAGWTRNKRKRSRLLESAQAALDEARRLCRESAILEERQGLLNSLR